MLNKNITKSIKVAQLSGYVSAETSYHHGEASLQQAIIGLAQNFIGSNNVNWLIPDGNFGSRINGGKDSASPRYIFTYLSAITKMVFDNRDTPLLNLLEEDGQVIEPEWYVPVIPSVLVNGCEGIGTGYSTYIPPHDIRDIISNIVRVLDEEQPVQMKPYFKNFSGEVVDLGNGNYITRGKWERLSDTQIKITELPIGTWITPYKEFLESLIENSGQPTKTASKKDTTTSKKDTSKTKKKFVLKDVRNKTSDENTGICFIVEFKDSDVLDKLIEQETIDKELKLVKPFNTNNMYLFDDRCVPTKYKSTTDILLDFCDIRLEYYTKRREYIMAKLKRELSILQSKVRFINEYINNDIVINKKSKESVIALLEERGYKKFCISESDEMTITNGKKSYDYLIRMPLVSLTSDKIDELTKQTNNKKHELDTITNQSPRDLWRIDLDSILTTYN
jgi:DNA topoisomerase-2